MRTAAGKSDSHNRRRTVYRGIPYAAPPIGDLRWKEPQPVVPWEGVKIADTFGRTPAPGKTDAKLPEGAFHSSDLWYVFKSLKHCWRPWTQGDWDLSEVMLTAWTNFAKYGTPYFVNNVSYDVSFISKLETPFQISEVIHIFTLRKYH